MRARLNGMAIPVWGFGVALALQKGWLDAFPDWGALALLVIPMLVFGYLFVTSSPVSGFLKRSNRLMSLLIFILVGAGIGGATWFALKKITARDSPSSDSTELTMSVHSYRYKEETKELIADVQFVNNGPVRRIVLGALFTYKLQSQRYYVADSPEDIRSHGNQAPIYVEPKAPIIATFRHKLANEAPLNTPGTLFGLEVRSVNVKGGENYTWVEVLEVIGGDDPDPDKATGYITDAQRIVSLDVKAGQNPMETQAQLRAKIEGPSVAKSEGKSPQPKPSVERETEPKNVPPARPESSSSPQEKKMANIDEVLTHLEGLTPLQAAKEIESYKGLWLEFEGESKGYPQPQGNGCSLELHLSQKRPIQCYFTAQSCEELDKANPNDTYVRKVRGKFLHYSRPHLSLSECELISTRQVQDAPKAAQPNVENPQLSALRDKLTMLLAKAERIKDLPDSQGFDMGQARRRNELFINQVREEIKRLEGERPQPLLEKNRSWQLREELAPLLATGVALKERCAPSFSIPLERLQGRAFTDHEALVQEAKKWAEEVGNYLAAQVGQMAVVKFKTTKVAGSAINPPLGWENWMFLRSRLKGLEAVIENLDRYIMPSS